MVIEKVYTLRSEINLLSKHVVVIQFVVVLKHLAFNLGRVHPGDEIFHVPSY